MDFKIIGKIRHPETFAQGSGIREMTRLRSFTEMATGENEKVKLPCVCQMTQY